MLCWILGKSEIYIYIHLVFVWALCWYGDHSLKITAKTSILLLNQAVLRCRRDFCWANSPWFPLQRQIFHQLYLTILLYTHKNRFADTTSCAFNISVETVWLVCSKTESQKFASPCNNYILIKIKKKTCRNPRVVAIHLNWDFQFDPDNLQLAGQDTHLSMRAAKKAAPSESAFQKWWGKFATLKSDKMRVVSWNLEIIVLTKVYMIIKHSEGAIPTQL